LGGRASRIEFLMWGRGKKKAFKKRIEEGKSKRL